MTRLLTWQILENSCKIYECSQIQWHLKNHEFVNNSIRLRLGAKNFVSHSTIISTELLGFFIWDRNCILSKFINKSDWSIWILLNSDQFEKWDEKRKRQISHSRDSNKHWILEILKYLRYVITIIIKWTLQSFLAYFIIQKP